MASQDEFSSRMLVHLKGLIGAKYPILLIRPIRCTSKKELHRYFADTQQSADAHDIIHVSTRGRGRLDGCRGSPAPRRKQRRSRFITYNNQILEGAAGGGNGLAFVERRMVASTSAMHEPMFRTDAYDEGAAIHRQQRRHPSPGVRWAVARGWGGCGRLVGAARV